MPVFISYDEGNTINSIVIAENKALAMAFWQGKDIFPITVVERTDKDLVGHPTGVLPILKTEKYNIGEAFNPKYKLVVKRG